MSHKKTCFVIIGFGPKTDFESGRLIDLDKTFENLIKPVFDELKINCFRAKEIRHSGIIDVPMYEWLYKADIVVADISTLNSNALYELGVRHALRPNTTIVISENQTKYPFDISHTVIIPYEHLGKDIGFSETTRFRQELKSTVKEVLRKKTKDSPVYTFLPKLKPPVFSETEIDLLTSKPKNQVSLSELFSDAENAKNRNDFEVAIMLYEACLKFEPQNTFLRQRLALVTYKNAKPTLKKALLKAESILSTLTPDDTTDIETLGLSGAINKRLYEVSNKINFLNKSINYYAKGYHIAHDHYNGINYAYLLTIKATIQKTKDEAISFFSQSQRVREDIVKLCLNLIKDTSFEKRDDKEWIYQSLAQAYLGLGRLKEMTKILTKIKKLSKGKFDIDTFNEHNKKLIDSIKLINTKFKK